MVFPLVESVFGSGQEVRERGQVRGVGPFTRPGPLLFHFISILFAVEKLHPASYP